MFDLAKSTVNETLNFVQSEDVNLSNVNCPRRACFRKISTLTFFCLELCSSVQFVFPLQTSICLSFNVDRNKNLETKIQHRNKFKSIER
jgi:hypothetical protein